MDEVSLQHDYFMKAVSDYDEIHFQKHGLGVVRMMAVRL